MRQSIKKNIFLFLIIFLILLGFPIKGYCGQTYKDYYTSYVPSGGSYSQSGSNFKSVDTSSSSISGPSAVLISYTNKSGGTNSYSVGWSKGDKTYDDSGSGYYSRSYKFPRAKVTTVSPGGCASADIYKECDADAYYDKSARPKYSYSSTVTGEIVLNNVTGTVNFYIKTVDGDTYFNYYTVYVCTSHTYGGYTTVKDSTC